MILRIYQNKFFYRSNFIKFDSKLFPNKLVGMIIDIRLR